MVAHSPPCCRRRCCFCWCTRLQRLPPLPLVAAETQMPRCPEEHRLRLGTGPSRSLLHAHRPGSPIAGSSPLHLLRGRGRRRASPPLRPRGVVGRSQPSPLPHARPTVFAAASPTHPHSADAPRKQKACNLPERGVHLLLSSLSSSPSNKTNQNEAATGRLAKEDAEPAWQGGGPKLLSGGVTTDRHPPHSSAIFALSSSCPSSGSPLPDR